MRRLVSGDSYCVTRPFAVVDFAIVAGAVLGVVVLGGLAERTLGFGNILLIVLLVPVAVRTYRAKRTALILNIEGVMLDGRAASWGEVAELVVVGPTGDHVIEVGLRRRQGSEGFFARASLPLSGYDSAALESAFRRFAPRTTTLSGWRIDTHGSAEQNTPEARIPASAASDAAAHANSGADVQDTRSAPSAAVRPGPARTPARQRVTAADLDRIADRTRARRRAAVLVAVSVVAAVAVTVLVVTRARDQGRAGGPDQSAPAGAPAEDDVAADPIRYESPTRSEDPVASVAFSPNGTVLAAGSGDDDQGVVELWAPEPNAGTDAADNHLASLAHDSPVTSVAFSPDGSLLASGSDDGTVALWDTDTHERLTALQHDRRVSSVSFSPDGNLLAVGTGGLETTEIQGPDGPVDYQAYAWSVELWDPTTHEHVASLTAGTGVYGDGDSGTPVAFSPDGNLLASGLAYGDDDNAYVYLWDPHTHELVADLRDDRAVPGDLGWVNALVFSSDGGLLIAASDERSAVWDLTTRRIVDIPGLVGGASEGASMAFSPDDNLLAIASGGDVRCLRVDADDVAPFDECFTVFVEGEIIDGDVLDAIEGDHAAEIQSRSGQQILEGRRAEERIETSRSYWEGHAYSVAFSPDGTMLANGDLEGSVWVYSDPETPIAER